MRTLFVFLLISLILAACSGARTYQPYICNNCVVIGGEYLAITDEKGKVIDKIQIPAGAHIEIKEIRFDDGAKTEIKVDAKVEKNVEPEGTIEATGGKLF